MKDFLQVLHTNVVGVITQGIVIVMN